MRFTKDGHYWTPITKKEVNDQIQYWWSRYLNYPMRDELKQTYLELSNAYKHLLKYADNFTDIE